jgi:hypothetical protein
MSLVPVPPRSQPQPPLLRTSRLSLAGAFRRWSAGSQARARRNAMVALTSLAQRRAEREDAEAFLAAMSAARHGTSLTAARRRVADRS